MNNATICEAFSRSESERVAVISAPFKKLLLLKGRAALREHCARKVDISEIGGVNSASSLRSKLRA